MFEENQNQPDWQERDRLTGLWTREAMIGRINQQVWSGGLALSELSCVYFDIKAFKLFHTRNGFDLGCRCLIDLSEKLREAFPDSDICRSDNDHFILFAGREGLLEKIQRLSSAMQEQWRHTGLQLTAGIYEPLEGETDVAQICSHAQIACKVNEAARTGVSMYDERMERTIRLRQHITQHFSEALEENHIEVYYQPIYHVLNGRPCGVEALSRWKDPEFGMLVPEEYVDVLIEARQIHLLDLFVIRRVCRDSRHFIESGSLDSLPVSINISRMDFVLCDMAEEVKKIASEFDVPLSSLSFEIQEDDLAVERESLLEELSRLKALGCQIHLDDFASKLSPLQFLKEFSFDSVKIESSFLADCEDGLRAKIIMKNLINMAKELGIQTQVSQVESEGVLEFLRQIGCEKTQGHLLSQPMSIDRIWESEVNSRKGEKQNERDYYDAIGKVNVLSASPLKTGWSYLGNEAALLNVLPLAIMEYGEQGFKFLMSSKPFDEIFVPMGLDEEHRLEDVFGNEDLTFSRQAARLAKECVEQGRERECPFVTSAGFYRIRMRCIAYHAETETGAIVAVAERLGRDNPVSRGEQMDRMLRFLYTLYHSVVVVDPSEDRYDVVYVNESRFQYNFVVTSWSEMHRTTAQTVVHGDDRDRFLEFFNFETIETRLREVGGHLTEYFRTRNIEGAFEWIMYMIIPAILEGKRVYLLCARNVDVERLRVLPEISQSGSVYYDMPGNPTFLLLATGALTHTLGYGSFEQFLTHSFYLEASLSDNKTIYMHLGQSGLISDFGETGYIELPYDDMIRSMVFSTVTPEDREKMVTFYDRSRIMEAYSRGIVSENIHHLRQTGRDEAPRYQYSCYQVRASGEDGGLRIFVLNFDVDDFKRTNETIHRLAERDTLTGLYNRSTVGSKIWDMLHNEETSTAALVILDLDYFKQINDRFGHDCGDRILKDASKRMRCEMESYGLVARIGGDEFLAVMRNQSKEKIDEILSRFTHTKKTLDYQGKPITYTMSIGCAFFPEHGDAYNDLYQRADMALYNIKMAGRNGYRFYEPGLAKSNREHLGFNTASLSDGMPGGFLVYRANDTRDLVYANGYVLELYECDNMEMFRKFSGNSFRGLVMDEDWKRIYTSIRRQQDAFEDYEYVRFRAVTAGGHIKVIEYYGRLYHSQNDGDLYYVFLLDFRPQERY